MFVCKSLDFGEKCLHMEQRKKKWEILQQFLFDKSWQFHTLFAGPPQSVISSCEWRRVWRIISMEAFRFVTSLYRGGKAWERSVGFGRVKFRRWSENAADRPSARQPALSEGVMGTRGPSTWKSGPSCVHTLACRPTDGIQQHPTL